MKAVKNILVVIGGVFVFFFLLGLVIQLADKPNYPATTVATTGGDVEVKPDVMNTDERAAFLKSCQKGGNESYCNCALSYLERHYTRSQIAEMGNSYLKTGTTPDAINEAAKVCLE